MKKIIRKPEQKPKIILHKRKIPVYEKEAYDLLSVTPLRGYIESATWKEIGEISDLLEQKIQSSEKSIDQIVQDTKRLLSVRQNMYVTQAISFLYSEFFNGLAVEFGWIKKQIKLTRRIQHE
jgi:hypothetical protein